MLYYPPFPINWREIIVYILVPALADGITTGDWSVMDDFPEFNRNSCFFCTPSSRLSAILTGTPYAFQQGVTKRAQQ